MAYRKYLKQIHDGLGTEDMKKLRFLCKDLLSVQSLEKVARGLQLFTELEKMTFISKDDVSLLVELLDLICRKDLVKDAMKWPNATLPLVGNQKISRYR